MPSWVEKREGGGFGGGLSSGICIRTMTFEVGFILAHGLRLAPCVKSSVNGRTVSSSFSQRGVRVRRAAYGEEFNEFETKGTCLASCCGSSLW